MNPRLWSRSGALIGWASVSLFCAAVNARTIVSSTAAVSTDVPFVTGEGVQVEVFANTGGGAAPAPGDLVGLTPTDETLSPQVYFRRSKPSTGSGSLEDFFEESTVLPEALRGLNVSNFTARATGLLKVTGDWDDEPDTATIEVTLAVTAAGGWHPDVAEQVQTNGFHRLSSTTATTYVPLSFESEGLYPVTLLFAGEPGYYAYVQLWRQHGTGRPTIPVERWFQAPNPAQQQLTFEEWSAGKRLTDEFKEHGIRFRTINGDLQVTAVKPDAFVPVTRPRVYGDPAVEAEPGELEFWFVEPGTTNLSTTSFVQFYVINAEGQGATVTAFGPDEVVLFSGSYHGGGGVRERVRIEEPGIARVRVTLGSGEQTAALDNLSFATPDDAPDLVVRSFEVPSPVVVREPFEVRWTVENAGNRTAHASWRDRLLLSANARMLSSAIAGAPFFRKDLLPGASVTITQQVTLTAIHAGQRYFSVRLDANEDVAEKSEQNNQATTIAPIQVLAPDVALEEIIAPLSADQGETITVSYRIRNVGTAPIPAGSTWKDYLYLANTASGSHPRQLLIQEQTIEQAIPVNGTRTFNVALTLPLRSAVPPGDYFLYFKAARNWKRDPVWSNNTIAKAITLTQPPLPDLAVISLDAPTDVVANQPLELRWVLTNHTDYAAPGPWSETIAVSPDQQAGADVVVQTTTFSDGLPPHGSVERVRTVRVPSANAGQRWFVVTTDSHDDIPEAGVPANNTLVASGSSTIRAADLVAEDVVAPASAFYGDTIPVAWTVRNVGDAPAEADWDERLVLWDGDQPGVDFPRTTIKTFDRLQSLEPGASYRRTNEVVLPLHSDYPDAALLVEVEADVYHRQPESNEEDNRANSSPIALSIPNLPNLVVTDVRAPATADPGQTIPLTWTVTNSGPGEAVAPWRERVFVSGDTNLGDDLSLTTFLLEESLAAGASITRTQQVVVPVNGFWGNQWFVVQADSSRQVVEENDDDNSSLSAQPTFVAAALSLKICRDTVRENAGASAVKALLTRNAELATDLVVSLTSSDPSQVTVPGTVTIPVNQTSISVPVTPVEDHYVDGDRNVRIDATAEGFLGASDWLTVLEVDKPGLSLVLPEIIEEGATAQGVIRRNNATNEVLQVALWTDSLWRLRATNHVVLAAGELEAPFEFWALQNESFEGLSKATSLATATNYPSVSRTVQIADDDHTIIELTVADSTLTESGPGAHTEATVTRTPVTERGLVVTFSVLSDGPLVHPRRIIIPANEAGATFNLYARDDALVNGDRPTALTAYAVNDLSQPVPEISSAVDVVVLDDDGPALTFKVRPAVIAESGTATGTVTRNTEAAGNLEVTLSSGAPTEATVPASVVIPDGQVSATFTVSGMEDGVSDGAREVVLTAGAAGYSSGVAHLVVSDIDLPDLEVSGVSGPTNALTDEVVAVSFAVTNNGLVAASGEWADHAYLSPSRNALGDFLGAITNFTGTLDVGAGYARTLNVPMPHEPGRYWIQVVTDAERALLEGTRRNNRALSAVPIDVLPAYQAVAWTEVEVAPNGTPIPIEGHAWMTGNTNVPAALEEIEVSIRVRRVRRTLTTWTDREGNFATVFQPLPTEAGLYTLGAQYPGDTDSDDDQFLLLGMKADAEGLNHRLVPGEPLTGEFRLRNLSDVPLSGLTVTAPDAPAEIEAQFTLPEDLPGDGEIPVTYTLNTSGDSAFVVTVLFHAESAEGVFVDLPVKLTVVPLRPDLAASPPYLERGMVRGEQTVLSFEVANRGGAPTGPLDVLLPSVPWMSLASTDHLPSLAPGKSASLTLRLHPADDLPLAQYDGSLAIAGAKVGLNVPFQFRAISTAVGDLHVAVEDQYSYYVDGAPLVTNATVTVRDPFTGDTIAEGDTGETGEVLFTGLPEGRYSFEVFAPRHSPYRGVANIEPGVTTEMRPFVDRATVTYQWRVVPTEIEDRYRIVLESVFEAEVPVPNLVVETPIIMPLVVPGLETQTEVVLRNEGLIALHDVHFGIPNDPDYIITPLVREIGTMPAKSRFVIPVTIRHRNIPLDPPEPGLAGESRAQAATGGGGGGGCNETGVNECLPKIPMPVFAYYMCKDNRLQKQVVDFRPVCTAVEAYKCMKGLKDAYEKVASNVIKPDAGGVGSGGCDAIAAVADCLNPNIPPCVKGPLKALCKAAVAVGTKSGGAAADGAKDLLDCLCSLKPWTWFDFDTSTQPRTISGVGYGTVVGASGTWYAGPPEGDDCGGGSPGAAARKASGVRAAGQSAGVCAQVRVRIEQEAVLTRAAFVGSLEVDNNGADALSEIRVDLDIRDAAGQPAADKFQVRGPRLTGWSDVSGAGRIPPATSASARYTFIPTRDAAPDAPAVYRIGGTLRYTEAGQEVVISLVSDVITVLPEARLVLDYFQQRDVYADDPFTDEVEPSEPFALGLIAKNIGAGWARKFRITSAQPQIVENEKGLLIDFKIIGTQVGADAVAPSLTADLGEIAPGGSRVAEWLLTSSLQGKFLDYSATFEHVDSLGFTNLSLIESVDIHELIHVVRADRAGDDELPDFLVNDDDDPLNLPDTLYLSDGTLANVNVAGNPAAAGTVRAGRFEPCISEVLVKVSSRDGWGRCF